jgi:hypothetical protein
MVATGTTSEERHRESVTKSITKMNWDFEPFYTKRRLFRFLMLSALFWVIMQSIVVIITDVSGNLLAPSSRLKNPEKSFFGFSTFEVGTYRFSQNFGE